jgi:SAM-dependent methyltransferase
MSIEASMVSYYAARACEYERIYHKPERQADLKRLRSFVETVFAGADVFEVACGTGYWTEVLARRAISVVASDINAEVLAIARAKPMDAAKVTFQQADAYTPSAPRPFNAGFSAFWWSHVPRSSIRTFLHAFHGVLAPGARVMFLDNVYVEGSSTPISRSDSVGNTYQLRPLDDGSTYEVLKNFPTEDELRAAVEGLAVDVQVAFLPYYWTLTYRLARDAERGIGQK